ncbi:hypothetical protein D3C72_1165300 [compost metagenome]
MLDGVMECEPAITFNIRIAWDRGQIFYRQGALDDGFLILLMKSLIKTHKFLNFFKRGMALKLMDNNLLSVVHEK